MAEEGLRPIIVKRIKKGGGGHHGGAWKIAYADFVTAMMAFFLLMWLLGATTEKQRKALADYFAPTLIEFKQNSAGSNGLLGGDALNAKDNYPTRASGTGTQLRWGTRTQAAKAPSRVMPRPVRRSQPSGLLSTQAAQLPQVTEGRTTTRRPWSAPEAMTPTNSWPSVTGRLAVMNA